MEVAIIIACLLVGVFLLLSASKSKHNEENSNSNAKYGYTVTPLNSPIPSGAVTVTCPMPGKILKVLCKPGDRVKAADGLLFLEAMKMENEIMAPEDGVVYDIRCVQNQSVQAGDILVVIKTDNTDTTKMVGVQNALSPAITVPVQRPVPKPIPTNAVTVKVTAPMPGTIVNSFVQAGYHVEAGDILINIESTIIPKFPNYISAPEAGMIYDVPCVQGQTVVPGDLLVVIIPREKSVSTIENVEVYHSPNNYANNSEIQFFVTVKFPYGRNEYDYLCDDNGVVVGDMVLVPARGQQKMATVTKTFYQNIYSMPLAANKYKKVITVNNDNRSASNNIVEEYEDIRCVNVIFQLYGNEYSYRCDDDFISEDDFVRVRAKGKLKTAKVTEVFYETGARYSSVFGLASDDEIEAVADRFDEFANVDDDYPSYSAGSNYSRYDSNYSGTSYGAANTSNWRSDEDDEEDYYERLRNNNSLTDDRGYMRDGKAEELMYQLEKAKKLGRLTDDRGFIIDEDYVLNRYYHYDPDEDWEEKDRDDDY